VDPVPPSHYPADRKEIKIKRGQFEGKKKLKEDNSEEKNEMRTNRKNILKEEDSKSKKKRTIQNKKN
jgi:hypothetical protein